MKIHPNVQTLQHILPVEHTMMLLHVEQFDRKHVHRSQQFMARHAERRRLLLPVPPLRRRSQRLQGRERRVSKNAKQIQIRQPGMEISRHGGAEENDRLKVGACGLLEPLHKFVYGMDRNHRVLAILPTTAGPASTGTASAEPAEATAATKAA